MGESMGEHGRKAWERELRERELRGRALRGKEGFWRREVGKTEG